MVKRMLVDATHPEETRVVVVDGTKLDEFDFEAASRKPLKGNIYLAKVVRIEPSLQAAFVEYGGNRHGFLAFNEIHPDYYQIPVADRERLLAEQAQRSQRHDDDEDDRRSRRRHRVDRSDIEDADEQRALLTGAPPTEAAEPAAEATEPHLAETAGADVGIIGAPEATAPLPEPEAEPAPAVIEAAPAPEPAPEPTPEPVTGAIPASVTTDAITGPAFDDDKPAEAAPETIDATEGGETIEAAANGDAAVDPADAPQPEIPVEVLGGDDYEPRPRRSPPPRQYKIQEVIKRRQILLVQVVKEERGNKGAALTTYLSLAGRYAVLMPNAGRGGGISRKITNAADRKRMKEMLAELDVPQGMGVILRTAGLERSKPEVRRDYDYLMRLWDSIRELTLKSTAPALIYEEGDIIKRSIRDLYNSDIEEIWVEGDDGFNLAQDFMRQLIPSQAGRIKLYDDSIPLFHRYQVEVALDAMHSASVQLRTGAYIVINPTEALVAIDVNSGRATKERNIEETALRTNLEAAEEIARQVRLRDLAGLVVIDFIDMEESKHQQQVERRLKEAMRSDRARIQIGRISPFGLLELSRQRLRPSLLENSTEICPHCEGSGRIRSVESTALHVLRGIEEEAIRRRASEIVVSVPTPVALYILNHKRANVAEVEDRYALRVLIVGDDELIPPHYEIERTRARVGGEQHQQPQARLTASAAYDEYEDVPEGEEAEAVAGVDGAEGKDDDGGRRRRRRRRRGGRRDEQNGEPMAAAPDDGEPDGAHAAPPMNGEDREPVEAGADEVDGARDDEGGPDDGSDEHRRRRRGRRGGRGRRREREDGEQSEEAHAGTPPAERDEEPATPFVPVPIEAQPEAPPRPIIVEPTIEPIAVEKPVTNGEMTTGAAPAVPPPEPPPPPAIPSTSVEAPPDKPKRGWWSRMTGG
ncbi:MAG: ribonuclease E/G [Alphaproteobacteria bacterium]|nr:ribonuclease E/G [Alphaproteobacteria bacterium]